MGMVMHSGLDILGDSMSLKYPPFPSTIDLSTGSVGVLTGEDR